MMIRVGDVVQYSEIRRQRMRKLNMSFELVSSIGDVVAVVESGPIVRWRANGTSGSPPSGDLAVVRHAPTPTLIGKMIEGGRRYYFKRLRRFAKGLGSYTWVPEKNQATRLTTAEIDLMVPLFQASEGSARVFLA